MAVVEKRGERIHVRPASPAAGDDLVVLHRHVVFRVVEGGVGLDDKSEGQLGLFEEGCGRGHGVESAPDIFRWTVGVGGGGDGRLGGMLASVVTM